MQVGLLWHDSGSGNLARKLARAEKRYKARFGSKPNVCYVHPTQLPEGQQRVNGIEVRSSGRVLRHHFWLGQESASD